TTAHVSIGAEPSVRAPQTSWKFWNSESRLVVVRGPWSVARRKPSTDYGPWTTDQFGGGRMIEPGISQCPSVSMPSANPQGKWRWRLALAGQFVFVFAILILSGPGRIDIVDGQTRYEVARSLIDHGDSIIRDPEAWFAVYPGRDGDKYTNYRFPQTGTGLL